MMQVLGTDTGKGSPGTSVQDRTISSGASNSDAATRRASQTFDARSRLQHSRSERANDVNSWATDGQMKGHVLLVRNSGMLVANIIAARSLQAQLWDLAREREESLLAKDRERELFLKHLKRKGGLLREKVVEIESRKKTKPSEVHLPYSERDRILRHAHQYPPFPRVRRATSAFVHFSPKPLMVHPLPFMADGNRNEEQPEEDAENDQLPADGLEPDVQSPVDGLTPGMHLPVNGMAPVMHKNGSQSAHILRPGRHLDHLQILRSSSAAPVARRRYESYIPAKSFTGNETGDFLPLSLVQFLSDPAEAKGTDTIQVPTVCDGSSRVFSDCPRRSLMQEIEECARVSQLIKDIDSLHVPLKTPKKVKPRSDTLIREIFRL